MKVCVITFKEKGKDYIEPYIIECPKNVTLHNTANLLYTAIDGAHGILLNEFYEKWDNFIENIQKIKHSTAEMRKLLGNPPKGINPIVVSIDFRHIIPQENNE